MGDNTRKDRRTKVLSMTVRYRSATLGEFIEHHSYDVSRGGMFIKTPSPFPPGTLLKFEVKIADEQRVMQGVGRVVWKRDQEGVQQGEPMGMGIKFIKIDEASRTVIDRLVGERGEDTKGAYDRSPEAGSERMFPASPAVMPEPEDRTVMKSANQLLKDALEKTGEKSEGAEPERTRDKESSFTPLPPSPPSEQPSPQDDVVDAEAGPDAPVRGRSSSGNAPTARTVEAEGRRSSAGRGARPGTNPGAGISRPRTNPGGSPSRPRTSPALEDDEGSGGRALLTILAAVVVAGGIYIVTKPDAGPPRTGPESAAPSLPASPSPEVPDEDVPQPEVEQKAQAEHPAMDEAPAEVVAPSAAEETTETPTTPPRLPERPAPKPAPVPKPAPPPAPVPKPAPPPQPVPKPAPEPSPAPAVVPTSAPSAAPKTAPEAPPKTAPVPSVKPNTSSPAPADTATPE